MSLIVILRNKQMKQLQAEKIFAVDLTAPALSLGLHYSWLGQIFASTDPAQSWYRKVSLDKAASQLCTKEQ